MAINHLAAINAGTISMGNIIGIRKALSAEWRRHRGYSAPPLKLHGEALREVMAAIHMQEPIVSHELDASGRKLLQDRRYRKRWTVAQRAIIDSLWGFRLVRFDDVARGHFVPVYRACGTNGESFLFRNIPWQSAFALGLESGPTVESI